MNGWARHTFQPSRKKKSPDLLREREGLLRRPQSLRRGPETRTASPSHTHSSHPLKKRPTQINNIVPSLPASSVPSPPSRAQRAPVLREAATGGRGADLVRDAEREAGAQAACGSRTMLPSAVAAHAGAYWDVVASSALLNFPTAPGFGNLGKSFLIENLLRAGGAPPHGLQPPAHHGPASALVAAAATAAGAQVRPLPASPVPLKLCPATEQVSPGGAPYGTRWAFQVLSPSADGARLPGRTPADRDCSFQPSAPGELAFPSPPAPGASCPAGPGSRRSEVRPAPRKPRPQRSGIRSGLGPS